MWDVFLLLVHNLILRPLVSDMYLKIWALAGTWCVIVSAHLFFLKLNFLAITDESMKTHPQFPSPLPQIWKEKANKTNATMFKNIKITLFALGGASAQIWTLEADSFTSPSFWIAASNEKAHISAWELADCGRWWKEKMTFVRLHFSSVDSLSWVGCQKGQYFAVESFAGVACRGSLCTESEVSLLPCQLF